MFGDQKLRNKVFGSPSFSVVAGDTDDGVTAVESWLVAGAIEAGVRGLDLQIPCSLTPILFAGNISHHV